MGKKKCYCPYCDVYLIHNSLRARRDHTIGYRHVANFHAYYARFFPQYYKNEITIEQNKDKNISKSSLSNSTQIQNPISIPKIPISIPSTNQLKNINPQLTAPSIPKSSNIIIPPSIPKSSNIIIPSSIPNISNNITPSTLSNFENNDQIDKSQDLFNNNESIILSKIPIPNVNKKLVPPKIPLQPPKIFVKKI